MPFPAEKPIGHYRHPIFGCEPGWGDVVYAMSPFFDVREGYTMVGPMLQVLVEFFGEMIWINVFHHDVVMLP